MPIIQSSYNPSFLFKNGHFSTIYCGLFRKIGDFAQKRERIDLPDGDFLDLDWSFSDLATKKVVILIHGLEGNAQRAYVAGSAKHLNNNGFDSCAVNLRHCSGEINRKYRSYHGGATEDLEAVIAQIRIANIYSEIYIKGFSLGGNLILKYLGEERILPSEIKAAVAISVPCSLHDSQLQFLDVRNKLYGNRFRKQMKKKLMEKQQLHPDMISNKTIKNIRTLRDFDDVYTSQAHGFKNALDYYEKCSSLQFLPNITIPTLLINALNDSFLGADCFPLAEAENNSNLYLETPKYGGHVGFYGKGNITYSEKRTIKFFNEVD